MRIRTLQIESEVLKKHPSLSLGILGVTGLTGILGIREKAHIVPGRNQTVVVSGAAGACGTAAGQVIRSTISISRYQSTHAH